IPHLAGLETVDYLTSASIMELREVPEHLLVLGGGYIGLEFGQMFRRFGSQVTVVHRSGQILPREDADVAAELTKALESEGIRFLLDAHATRVEKPVSKSPASKSPASKSKDGRISLAVDASDGPTALVGSHPLVATGRKPSTDALELATDGGDTDQAG